MADKNTCISLEIGMELGYTDLLTQAVYKHAETWPMFIHIDLNFVQ